MTEEMKPMLMLSGGQQALRDVTPASHSLFSYLLITFTNHNTPAVNGNDTTVC